MDSVSKVPSGKFAGTPNPGGTFRDGDDGTGPKAYLNYILFDRNFNYLTGGFKRVTTAAREDGQGTDPAEGIDHEHLYFDDIVVEQAGYAYIYFSNENETPVEVFFACPSEGGMILRWSISNRRWCRWMTIIPSDFNS